ncbi:MAG TPA: hypothetical protein EYN96_12990 [Candidatus Hydrogenedentes bacterium]|nr:hypothetical protein [Candidatus Hydrogenedentota bacterium]
MREVLQHPNVRRCLPYLALFLVAYVTHFMSGVIASGDSRWSVPGAYSLVYDGDLTLDEFPEMLEEHEYYWADRIGSHWYTRFPIGMSLLSAPLVFALDVSSVVLFWVWPGLEERIIDASVKPLEEVTVLTMYWRIELVIACFFMSVAALLMFRIGREFLSSPKALILVFWFLYCTPVWSTGSRSLGQHCGSILMLTLALIFVLAARKNARWIQFAALPLAFSFVIRPTNALPIIAFTIYVLIAHRDYFVKYLGWAAVIAIPFSVYNWNVYDSLLAPYYLPQDQLGEVSPYETNYLNGMTGLLFSPARGLFVYSPLFVFSFAGATLGYRKTRDRLYVILPVLCIFHWLLLSSFGDWWGGALLWAALFFRSESDFRLSPHSDTATRISALDASARCSGVRTGCCVTCEFRNALPGGYTACLLGVEPESQRCERGPRTSLGLGRCAVSPGAPVGESPACLRDNPL